MRLIHEEMLGEVKERLWYKHSGLELPEGLDMGFSTERSIDYSNRVQLERVYIRNINLIMWNIMKDVERVLNELNT